jgi:dihydropyrimidinase
MHGALLIRGGTVVNADRQEKADVLCVDGVIAAVGAMPPHWRRRGRR